MTNPDTIIQESGEPITLSRVVGYTVNAQGAQDVQRELHTTKGIVSSPSEELEQRLSGRIEGGAITVTLPSGTDVQQNRNGGRDRIIRGTVESEGDYDGQELYTVIDVTRDKHPMVGIEKLTVACNLVGNRDDVFSEDGTYL